MSNSQNTPNWLVEARERHQRPASPDFREEEPADILPGDICVVSPFDDRSGVGLLFLVTDVHIDWCSGMMVTAQVELATEFDALLSPEEAALSYQIAIHTLYFGSIWKRPQIRSRVGAVEMPVLESLEDLARGGESSDVSLKRGQPLQPEGVDPRFPALKLLSLEFDRLTEHYRCHDLVPILDPAVGEKEVLKALLRERGWDQQMKSEPISCSSRFRDIYSKSLQRLSRDERRAAQPIGELALRSSPYRKLASEPKINVLGHKDGESLIGEIGQIQEGSPFATILTYRKCWNGEIPSTISAKHESSEIPVYFASMTNVALEKVA